MTLKIPAAASSKLLLGLLINHVSAKNSEVNLTFPAALTTSRPKPWAVEDEPDTVRFTNPDKLPHIRVRRLGGADRDRTGGLLVANQALSPLSYSPLSQQLALGT